MRYLSVCSGIEAASVAWHHLGWEPVGFSEIEPFPAAVLAHRFPNVPNYGDMTKHKEWPLEPGSIDLLVGGTPCQSFSVAGLRKGLHDPRGGLMLTYLEIAQRLRPRWVVWENVPGVLSSGGGRDFGSFLGALGELGYGWAYRVLDAQWVRTQRHPRAVPQRRRRVFVVGCLVERGAGDWTAAAEVLLESESVCRNPAESPKTRKIVAPDAEAGARAGIHDTVGALCADTHPGAYSRQDAYTGRLVPQPVAYAWQNNDLGLKQDDVTAALRSSAGTSGFHEMNHPVVVQGDTRATTVAVAFKTGNSAKARSNGESFEVTPTIGSDAGGNTIPAVAIGTDCYNGAITGDVAATMGTPGSSVNASGPTVMQAHAFYSTGGTHGVNQQPEVSPAVKVGSGLGIPSPPAVAQAMTVRRLTPVECERLQAFPDDWTLIPWRKRPADECPDGPRYKALGNSMAVNCMEWIGERIQAWEELQP